MGAPPRVLLVATDDEDAARVTNALRHNGYLPVVERVATPEAFRAAWQRDSWDLVIADCALPHFSGREALRLAREMGKDIPFLLICDRDEEKTASALMRAGAQDYLLRQDLTRLLPVVERELRQAEARREHARHEEELRRSAESYRHFVHQSTEGIYRVEFDPPIPTSWPVEAQIDAAFSNGYTAECNDRIAQMYGYAGAEEMIGKRMEDLQIRRDDPRYRAFLRSVIESGYHVSNAISHETDREGHRLVLSNSIVGVVEHGLLMRVWATQRDITEQIRMQEALQKSEARYRNLVEDISDWVWEVNTSAHYTYSSHRVMQILGYAPEELLGKTPFDFMAPKDAADIAKQFAEIAARHEPFSLLENTMMAKDGRRVVVEVNGIPRFDDEGRFTGYRGINRDITARKEAEIALQRQRAFLSTTVDVLPVALVFIAPTRDLIFANRVAQAYIREHGVQRWDEVEWFTRDHLPVPHAQWPINRALAHREISINIEGIIKFPDGVEVPALNQTAPVIVDGELVAVVAAFQDISELKAADEAKDRFLMYLSHELRTPLTSILGWAQAAQDNNELIPQALPIVIRNARYLSHMLQDLLDVSNMIAGRFMLEKTRTDLWEVTVQTIEDLQYAFQEHRTHLLTEAPHEPLPVNADPKRLHQAICHLVENAVKFTDTGGTVTISARREGQSLVLQVRDTGRGIAPEILPTLFIPFRQINRPQSIAGLGVGLALVKGIVELHGGTVTAASPGIGRGSTFTISLPAAE